MSASRIDGYRLTYAVGREPVTAQNRGLGCAELQFRETRRGAAALAQRLADRDGCDYEVISYRCSTTILMDAEPVGVPLIVSPIKASA